MSRVGSTPKQRLERWNVGEHATATTLRDKHRKVSFVRYLEGERYCEVRCDYNKGIHVVEALSLREVKSK